MKLLMGKMEEQLQNLEDNSVDSVVCDPPYGLSFMNKSWDYQVPSTEQWQEVFRVLKPGGHLIAFFGSRTYHRGAVAIEDAGFEVRDQIMWVYGSGFPKSYNIGKAYHGKMTTGSASWNKWKELGLTDENAKMGYSKICKEQGARPTDYQSYEYQSKRASGKKADIDNPWEGYGTSLKPSHEPMVLARKPISEKTIVDNVIRWGVGGLNIDACRIGDEEISTHHAPKGTFAGGELERGSDTSTYKTHTGRFPANFIHDGQVCEEPWDRFFYVPKVNKKERNAGGVENKHPTVKPIALMEYLIRMVTPTGGIVLDPFMGSGSTGCAAAKNDYGFIGIEMEQESYDVAKARIEHWEQQK